MDLKEIDILGNGIQDHWYYASKAKAMMRMIADCNARTILDIGAGSGFFSRHLLDHTAATASWCVDTSYEHEHDERDGSGKTLHFRRSVDRIDADLMLLMDVLEHVDDDLGLLSTYVDKVPSGCNVLITVPAFDFMWSGHDDYLEHKRRYTLPQMESVVRQAGLHIERGCYFFGSVFPLAAATRAAGKTQTPGPPRSQLRMHSPGINSLLKGLCAAELPVFKHNRLGGLSVFVHARK